MTQFFYRVQNRIGEKGKRETLFTGERHGGTNHDQHRGRFASGKYWKPEKPDQVLSRIFRRSKEKRRETGNRNASSAQRIHRFELQ